MKDWKKVLITPEAALKKAIEVIDNSGAQIALVVDADGRLKGTITDGDVRRAILRGVSLDEWASSVMNPSPFFVKESVGQAAILELMRSKVIHQVPIIDAEGRVTGVELLDEIIHTEAGDNSVVLMAGGLGSRLRPLTSETPKPLLKVGNKPILETIIENFMEYGFKRFFISINYKGEMIEDYFGDGSRWGAEITYMREADRMGTAGALAGLAGNFDKPVFVMNGDLLTRVNFRQLMKFHMEHKGVATMCVRNYDFQVPYGVVKIDKHRLVSIEEKPSQRFFVNAGIYVIEPEVMGLIPQNTFFDMPDLFKKLVEMKKETSVFLIREYWLDIGRIDDLERANGEFARIFE